MGMRGCNAFGVFGFSFMHFEHENWYVECVYVAHTIFLIVLEEGGCFRWRNFTTKGMQGQLMLIGNRFIFCVQVILIMAWEGYSGGEGIETSKGKGLLYSKSTWNFVECTSNFRSFNLLPSIYSNNVVFRDTCTRNTFEGFETCVELSTCLFLLLHYMYLYIFFYTSR